MGSLSFSTQTTMESPEAEVEGQRRSTPSSYSLAAVSPPH